MSKLAFELFFDNDVMQLIVTNTNRYAMQKGAHSVLINIPELRLVLSIVVTSRYVPLLRHRMF